ncbi:fungal transcriptional regulatory n-terminal [Fusarium circinatum]|uniref:Fungal transcriptional regulatory n-terminal n=1 Tax=Fusarium circinatum TaxID=48490 RepID=A0A8H5WTD0_FUSCI|nr:fungal transcriptional regulatory n-terminal [Fusarium circinatum]
MTESQGCWSCRIRRKKCDLGRPVCGICATLHITCHTGSRRPPWFDGGVEQARVAAALKEEVRQGAARRRQDAHIQRLEERSSSIAIHSDEDLADMNLEDDDKSINRGSHGHYDNGDHKRTDGSTESSELPITTEGSELDLGFIMHYMDHVFPLFFPFYRASMLDDGRGWLLAQILKNPTLLSTVSCMTLFVFSIQVPDTFANKAPPCSAILWDKVTLQLEGAFSTIKGDIARLFPLASKSTAYAPNSVLSPANMSPLSSSIADLRHMCGLLTSIVQLICFEIDIGNSENCVTHLDAALELFDTIVKISLKDTVNGNNAQQQQWPGLSLVFRAIAGPPWTLGTYSGSIPRNADQVAFRFFSSILVVYDTMMSTALLRAPRLYPYHKQLLLSYRPCEASSSSSSSPMDYSSGRNTNGRRIHNSNPEFRMDLLDAEAIIGCQSWVLAVIGEIATLAAWKKERQAEADMADLDSRATHLRSTLETGLAKLPAHPPRSTSSISAAKTAATPDGISSLSATGMTPDTPAQQSWSTTTRSHIVSMTTQIWAHAAHIYLSVVVSERQSRTEALNKHIQEILGVLEELRVIDDPRHRETERYDWAILKTLAWPFCVMGCFAKPGSDRTRSLYGKDLTLGDMLYKAWT